MRKFYFLFLVSITLFSCEEKEETPDYLIEKERFVEILTEFQTAEAMVRLGLHRSQDSIIPNDSIYNAVFRKLEISQANFDSSYTYYSNRPDEFKKMFEQVITNLSKHSAEITAKSKKLSLDSITN